MQLTVMLTSLRESCSGRRKRNNGGIGREEERKEGEKKTPHQLSTIPPSSFSRQALDVMMSQVEQFTRCIINVTGKHFFINKVHCDVKVNSCHRQGAL